jgi:hypothetical protein
MIMKGVLLILLLLLIGEAGKSQCHHTFVSNQGYSVEVTLEPTHIIAPNTCPNGYNYNIEVSYEVAFSGTNIPGSLYTLQAYLDCGPQLNNYLDLPNNSGIGTTTTTTNPWTNDTDCATATPISRNCNTFRIVIDGPGIANQTVECSFALPVELLSFEAREENKGILITWSTGSEINHSYFDIERSENGKDWKVIHSESSNGNSNSVKHYQFLDTNLKNGTYYYRLKQVDNDNSFSYSPIRSLKLKKENQLYAFPNPASQVITIKNAQIEGGLKLLDLRGQDVSHLISYQLSGKEDINLNLSQLPPGYYFFYNLGTLVKIVKM